MYPFDITLLPMSVETHNHKIETMPATVWLCDTVSSTDGGWHDWGRSQGGGETMGKTSSDDGKEQALRKKTSEKTEIRRHMTPKGL